VIGCRASISNITAGVHLAAPRVAVLTTLKVVGAVDATLSRRTELTWGSLLLCISTRVDFTLLKTIHVLDMVACIAADTVLVAVLLTKRVTRSVEHRWVTFIARAYILLAACLKGHIIEITARQTHTDSFERV
jgi:hypothetical protein